MASMRTEGGAASLAPLTGRGDARNWQDNPTLLRIASVVLFAGVWQIAGLIPVSFAFPTFSDTVVAFVEMTADGSLPKAYLSTLQPLLLGVVLSAFLGVGLGTVCGLWRTGEWLLIPVFIVLQAAPVAAFIPMVTFIYGIGMTAKTLAVMILALPVIVLNTYKAVRNVNVSLVAMCQSFLGTRWQVEGFVELRGKGLMIGIMLDRPCGELVGQALDAGLVLNVTADTVVRLLPPLIFTEDDAQELVGKLVPLVRKFLGRARA